MKTIKFRIWNPEDKKMIESGATPMMLHSFFEYTARFNTQHEMPYQQFTGLLDKAGKEIYEGDIVEWYYSGERAVHKVGFTGASFTFDVNGNFYEIGKYAGQGLEVIGNCFENPNLLKGGK